MKTYWDLVTDMSRTDLRGRYSTKSIVPPSERLKKNIHPHLFRLSVRFRWKML